MRLLLPGTQRLPVATPRAEPESAYANGRPQVRAVGSSGGAKLPAAPGPQSLCDDPVRLRAMFEAHYDFIWRLIRRLGVSEGDVDDAAQRVFLVAARKIGQIAQGSERSFLFGTAMRTSAATRAARHLAQGGHSWEGNVDFEAPKLQQADELLEQKQRRALLDSILEGMDLDVRMAFVLFELDGLTAPEIASVLGIPIGTVASRLRRGRAEFLERAERIRKRMHRSEGER